MLRKPSVRIVLFALALGLVGLTTIHSFPSAEPDSKKGPLSPLASLEARLATHVKPFLERYCVSCHGSKKPKAELDLTRDTSVAAIVKNLRHWEMVLGRLLAR